MQWLPLSRRTAQTSLGTTRFFLSIHLPHLSRRIPCSYWALTWVAVLPSCITLYEISVRQTRDLPGVSLFPHPASFRFHLTMDTLAFGYILPTTGRIRDFNPLETCAARRTTQKNGKETVVTVFFPFFTIISFFNFTQLLVFHTYKADIHIRFATCQWELYRTEFSVQKIPTCEQLLQFYHMFCEKVFRGSNS